MKKAWLALAALGYAAGASHAAAPARSAETEASRAAITDFARLLRDQNVPVEAFHKYFAPGLIQHDPWIADGNGGDEDFLDKRQKAHPEKFDTTDNYAGVIHTIMADGDLVAIKSHVFIKSTDRGREFVDIWRVKDGKFVEHWDVIQPIENPADVGCGKGGTYAQAKTITSQVDHPACGSPDPKADSAASRELVLSYMAMGQQPGRLEEAVNRYVADDFVQHSGHIAPGRAGLLQYLKSHQAERNADHRHSKIARVLADGDLVLVHRRVTSDSNPRGIAYADLFRVRGGKVVEHWDVVQPIPEFSVSGRSLVDGPLESGRHKGPPPPGQME